MTDDRLKETVLNYDRLSEIFITINKLSLHLPPIPPPISPDRLPNYT